MSLLDQTVPVAITARDAAQPLIFLAFLLSVFLPVIGLVYFLVRILGLAAKGQWITGRTPAEQLQMIRKDRVGIAIFVIWTVCTVVVLAAWIAGR